MVVQAKKQKINAGLLNGAYLRIRKMFNIAEIGIMGIAHAAAGLRQLRASWWILPVLAGLVWFGLLDRPDPIWAQAGHLMAKRYSLLYEQRDSVELLYADIHPESAGKKTGRAWSLMKQAGNSLIDWQVFQKLCRAVARQRFIVVSGVTGTGLTKQSKRAALLVAGAPERVLYVACAPQFDLDLHRQYVGRASQETGKFEAGEMLEFWERCYASPGQRFVALIDNIDKINPETFFGPELWEALGSSRDTANIGGKPRPVPPNFHLISTTHLGPGSLTELNEEHFKRIGRQHILHPNPRELLEYLHRESAKLAAKSELSEADKTLMAAYADSLTWRRFLFYWIASNRFVASHYGEGYQLGQGAQLRACIADLEEFKNIWRRHLTALKVSPAALEKAFERMDYTAYTHPGQEAGSSLFARWLDYLENTGYMVEITMVACTALLTALIGWWMFRHRERLIRRYGEMAQQLFNDFEAQKTSAEEASTRLNDIRKEVDRLVMQRKLNYTEGLYFLAFVEDKTRRIDMARQVSEHFLELFNAFMDDNVLTENEYHKLIGFLQAIRLKIPEDIYNQFRDKVEIAYAETNRV